jgi:FAD:protein FMN transferase
MTSYSSNRRVERAQPWLGTLVSIRVQGLPPAHAHRAIDAAFEEVATVHRLMSFHEAASDVSRLNTHAHSEPVSIHPWTREVLRWSLDFSALSDGCFDISVAAELVEWRLLPALPAASCRAQGTWRDIELRSDGRVYFHRPLWIDLGGIAKGYAVDRATDCLRRLGAAFSAVNAGGDIRVSGTHTERIALGLEFDRQPAANGFPVIELTDGSIASSYGTAHVDGVRRTPAMSDCFVSVIAEQCVVADALTKIVMLKGTESKILLGHFRASAHIYGPGAGWRHLETAMEAA